MHILMQLLNSTNFKVFGNFILTRLLFLDPSVTQRGGGSGSRPGTPTGAGKPEIAPTGRRSGLRHDFGQPAAAGLISGLPGAGRGTISGMPGAFRQDSGHAGGFGKLWAWFGHDSGKILFKREYLHHQELHAQF